jgi:hypothetical protein
MSMSCSKEWTEFLSILGDLIDSASLLRVYEHECNVHNDETSCDLYSHEEDRYISLKYRLDETVKSLLSCLRGR